MIEPTGALARKMVSAVSDIDAVTKSGTNEKQGYKYVKAADVASEVRKVLVKHGIGFDYDVISTERWDKQTNAGGTLFFVQLEIAVTFTDQDTGEFRTVKSIGWGADSMDKAPYKAMTGALKYALRMNFLIPDESDPENDEPSRKQVKGVAEEAIFGDDPPASAYDEFNQEQRPAPTKKEVVRERGQNDVTGEAAISEGKGKRFWAIAIANGKKDEVPEQLASAGLSDIKCCPWKGKTYENLIAWAEGK